MYLLRITAIEPMKNAIMSGSAAAIQLHGILFAVLFAVEINYDLNKAIEIISPAINVVMSHTPFLFISLLLISVGTFK